MNATPFRFRLKAILRSTYYWWLPHIYGIKSLLRGGCLPDFLIVGVQKGGTTSLYNYLIQHPDVVPASRKEVHYFDRNVHRSLNWYKAHFRNAARQKKSNSRIITGECTPYYAVNPYIPEKIAKIAPDTKIIFILRDPVERAFSHYKHNVNRNLYEKPVTFSEALSFEEQIVPRVLDEMRLERNCYHTDHDIYSLRERGHYVEQIQTYEEYFPEKVFILTTEELSEAPDKVLGKLCEFLGLTFYDFNIKKVFNRNPQSFERDCRSIELLKAYFLEHNKNLETYLKKELNW